MDFQEQTRGKKRPLTTDSDQANRRTRIHPAPNIDKALNGIKTLLRNNRLVKAGSNGLVSYASPFVLCDNDDNCKYQHAGT